MSRVVYPLPLMVTYKFLVVYFATMGKGHIYLDLTSQGLTNLPDLNMTITRLNLRNNNIDMLGPYAFSQAPKLYKLEIPGNLLLQVHNLAFCETLIQTLKLQDNNLVEIPNLGCLNNTITLLDLTSNKIECLYETSLQLLKHLASLYLSNNHLLRIDYSSFCGTNLERVKLEQNFIGIVPDFSCVGKSIEDIYMKGNRIRNITRGAFAGISSNNLFIQFTDNHLSDVSVFSEIYDFSAPRLMLNSNNITCIASVSIHNILIGLVILASMTKSFTIVHLQISQGVSSMVLIRSILSLFSFALFCLQRDSCHWKRTKICKDVSPKSKGLAEYSHMFK